MTRKPGERHKAVIIDAISLSRFLSSLGRDCYQFVVGQNTKTSSGAVQIAEEY